MFSKLYRRYMRFLFPCVTLIFTCYALVSFLTFVRLLQTDYDDKIAYFSVQQTANVADYLRLAERNMNLFLLQNDPTDEDLVTSQAYNNLRKIQSISLDVSAAFLVNANSLYLNPLDSYDLLFGLRAQRDRFCIADGAFKWYYLEGGSITEDMLLCTKTVLDYKQDPFSLGVLIPADKILLNVSRDTEAMAGAGSFSVAIQCEPDAFLSLDNEHAIREPLSHHPSWKYNVVSEKIEGSPFTLRLVIARKTLSSFAMFFVAILALCAALVLAAYFTLRCYLRRLTARLESFGVRFSDFSEFGDVARETVDAPNKSDTR